MNHTVTNREILWDYCCGCGLCSAVCPRACLEMRVSEDGEYRPVLAVRESAQESAECSGCGLCLAVCPFAGVCPDDTDALGQKRFAGNVLAEAPTPELGWVDATFVGGVADDDARRLAPSGGLATATLCGLLRAGEIDAAILPVPIPEKPWSRHRVLTTEAEILQTRGSVYHVTTLGPVLREILAGAPRRYAITVLPCAVRAIRQAQNRVPQLRERLPYVFTLTCGGVLSLNMADLITVALHDNRSGIRYRSKRGSKNARDFRVEAMSGGENGRQLKMLGLFGFLWINDVGKPRSCALCDDVFGELADATFMDAWLPDYIPDTRGTSLVVSRNAVVTRILREAFAAGTLTGGHIAPDRVVESQGKKAAERLTLARRVYRWEQEHREEQGRGSELPTCRERVKSGEEPESEVRFVGNIFRFQASTRRYLRRFSQKYARPEHWFCRVYVYRMYWKVLCALFRTGLLGKTLRSLIFLNTKKNL